ncbi:DMT family transporter [Hwanghaeella grinnelliae]|nr:DMT family transporter [Hwanghaeella grinnelliae]
MTVRHWLLILATAASFGSSFFFIKLAVSDLPPMTIAAGRAMVAALVIGVVASRRGVSMPSPGPDWRPLLFVGALTAIVPYALIAMGQSHIDSSLGGILFASIPLFSLAFSRIAFPDQVLSTDRIAGAVIGLAGVAAVIGPQALKGLSGQLLGAGLTLAAAASYAAGGVFTRTQMHLPPMVVAAGQVMVAAPVLTIAAALTDAPWTLDPSAMALAAVCAAGLVSTALPVVLFFRLISEIGPTRTSILTFFMPVFSVLLGTILLGEAPGSFAYVGLALIISGAVLISRDGRKK